MTLPALPVLPKLTSYTKQHPGLQQQPEQPKRNFTFTIPIHKNHVMTTYYAMKTSSELQAHSKLNTR
jgi:hypothetical protein